MTRPPHRLRRPALRLLTGAVSVAVVAACAAPPDAVVTPVGASSSQTASTTEPGVSPRGAPSTSPDAVRVTLPSAHVHGIGRDPGSGMLVVAAHDGLYVYDGARPERVGPVIDLMGFTVAGPGHYYASGHPGTATDLPQPVGLIETRDGGSTWTVLSRGGRSDFHALTTAGQAVVGFDGTLRATADGRTWAEGSLDPAPRTLAGSRSGSAVLATTEAGLMRSTDGGLVWQPVDQAPRLLLVAFGDGESAVGVTPSGEVHTSTDAGRTWRATRLVAPQPTALSASGGGDDLEILVVSGHDLLSSTSGTPFEPPT